MSTHEDLTSWADQLEHAIESTSIDRVMVIEEALSTQDSAARACHGLPKSHAPTLVVASRQLMGRGQRASNWFDAPGCTLPCSLAIGQKLLPYSNAELAARFGIAVLSTIQTLAPEHDVKIKWPNDVVVERDEVNKKISGVLIEHARDSIVIGIGINCLQQESDYETSIQHTAVSLTQLGIQVRRIDVAFTLVESIEHWVFQASTDELNAHWQAHDALLGTTQNFVHNNTPSTGRVIAINPLDTINIETPTGQLNLPVEQTRLV